jgi:hypothetical protein
MDAPPGGGGFVAGGASVPTFFIFFAPFLSNASLFCPVNARIDLVARRYYLLGAEDFLRFQIGCVILNCFRRQYSVE